MALVRTKDFREAESWVKDNEAYIRDRGGYPVSKDALVVYTLDRCIDLAARGIRINVIGPGVTDTPMLEDSFKAHGPRPDPQLLQAARAGGQAGGAGRHPHLPQ